MSLMKLASRSTGRSRLLRRKLRRDLGRQPAPFIAVAVTMLLGVALFGAAYDAYRNLLGSYNRVFHELSVADIWVTGGDTDAIAGEVTLIDGVSEVATRVQVDVPMRVGDRKLAGRIVGLPHEPAVNDVYLLDGEEPPAGANDTVLADDHLASEFDLEPGGTVEVFTGGHWRALDVSGRASSGEYLWLARSRQEIISFPDEFGVVFAPDETVQRIVGVAPNQVLVRVEGRSTNAVRDDIDEIAQRHDATDVFTIDEQPSNSALSQDIDGFSQMALLFPLLFLTAAGMASYTVLSRRIHAERSIIGMFRAAGVARSVILRHYLSYGVAAGLAGAVPGILLGLWLARLLTDFYVGFLSIPVTAVSFHPETPVIGIAFGVIAGALAAFAPARQAAATPPAEAMRGIVPVAGGRRTLVERLVPFSSRMSASTRLVLRSIVRNRRRTAMTVSGVVLALLLILVSWSMLDTTTGNLDAQFGERDRSDARVMFAEPASEEDLSRLAAVDGVEVVEPSVVYPVSITTSQGSNETYATTIEALPDDTRLRSFDVIRGRFPEPGRPEIVVGAALRDLLDINVGDTVTVRATDESGTVLAEVDAPVVGFVQETLGTYAYTTMSGLASGLEVDEAPVNAAMVSFADGVDTDAVRAAIEKIDGVGQYRATDSFRELMDDMTGLLIGFVTIMLVIGGVMAATMIFTTASVSIAERTNEVATLRASGVSTSRIARLITAENLLVTALAVAPGLVAGVLGGRAMMSTYTTDQFSFDFLVEPITLVASAGAVFAVALLSQIPGLRALRRLDLGTTVRARAA